MTKHGNRTTAALAVAVALLLPSASARADVAVGIGPQYGGFIGVEYAWRLSNHVVSVGAGHLVFGLGASLSLKWLLGPSDSNSFGVGLHPVFGWSISSDDLEHNDDTLVSITYSWHSHAYRSHGSEVGIGLLFVPDPDFDDDAVIPMISVGYHF